MLIRIGLLILVTTLSAQSTVAKNDRPFAPNWQAEARSYLTKDDKPFDDDIAKATRCVLMNNYVCIKQNRTAAGAWNGTLGEDKDGHVIFSEAALSLRAMIRDLCSKHRRKAVTARAIMEEFSPWCDTNGSGLIKDGWGRTCRDKYPRVSDDHPRKCEKPKDGKPLAGQCGPCNCPEGAAQHMVAGLGLSIDDDLKLFGVDGSVNKSRLKDVLRNQTKTETGGYRLTDKLIERAILLAGTCPRLR